LFFDNPYLGGISYKNGPENRGHFVLAGTIIKTVGKMPLVFLIIYSEEYKDIITQ